MSKMTNEIAFAMADSTARAMETANAMIRDARVAAAAKRTAEHHTNCRNCQAGLENFLIQFPDCSAEAIEAKHQDIWEHCPRCRAEYVEVLKSQYCKHGNGSDCTECLDEWADANEPECDGILDKPSDWEVQNGY